MPAGLTRYVLPATNGRDMVQASIPEVAFGAVAGLQSPKKVQDNREECMEASRLAQREGLVPVVSAIDRNYVPIYSVFLASFLEHTSPDREYELILLTDNVPASAICALQAQTQGYVNVALRTIDMSACRVPNFSVHDKYTKATFFRLMVPELLVEYDRALYLDADIVVLGDVAELFDAHREELAAAVLDFEMQGMLSDPVYHMPFCPMYDGYEYLVKYCGMEPSQTASYFNAGVLALNLQEIRRCKRTEACLELLNTKPFAYVDQDILNLAFGGHVQTLPYEWNFVANPNPKIVFTQKLLEERERASAHIRLLHFAGPQPWREARVIAYEEYFWFYARKSMYYEALLRQKQDAQIRAQECPKE